MNLLKILILLFIVIFSNDVSAQKSQIFREIFTKEMSGWETLLTQESQFHLRDVTPTDTVFNFTENSLLIKNLAYGKSLYLYKSLFIEKNKNFQIDYLIKFVNNSAGIEFLWGAYNTKHRLAFCIRKENDKYYYRISNQKNNKIGYTDWQPLIFFKADEMNKFTVKRILNHYEYYLNGAYITKTNYQKPLGNKTGIKLEAGNTIELYEIKAKYLSYNYKEKKELNKNKPTPNVFLKILYPIVGQGDKLYSFTTDTYILGELYVRYGRLEINNKKIKIQPDGGFIYPVKLSTEKKKLRFELKHDNGTYRKWHTLIKTTKETPPPFDFSVRFEKKSHIFPDITKLKDEMRVFPYEELCVIQYKKEKNMIHSDSCVYELKTIICDYNGEVLTQPEAMSLINQKNLRQWYRLGLLSQKTFSDKKSLIFQPYNITINDSPYHNKLKYTVVTEGENIYLLGTDSDCYYLYDFHHYNNKQGVHQYQWLNQRNASFELSDNMYIGIQGKNKIDENEIEVYDNQARKQYSIKTKGWLSWLSPKGNNCALTVPTKIYFDDDYEEKYRGIEIVNKKGKTILRKGNYKVSGNVFKFFDERYLLICNEFQVFLADLKKGKPLWENNKGYLTNKRRIACNLINKRIYLIDYYKENKKFRFIMLNFETGFELINKVIPYDIEFDWYENELLFVKSVNEIIYRNEKATYQIKLKY